MLRYGFLVLALAAVALGAAVAPAEPKKCCSPDMFTASITQHIAMLIKTPEIEIPTTQFQFGKLYMNYVDQQMAMNMTVANRAQGSAKDEVYPMAVYRKGTTMHIYLPKFNYCFKTQVPVQMTQCVPEDAEYVSKRRYGDEKVPIMADVFKHRYTLEGVIDVWSYFSLMPSCTPVTLKSVIQNNDSPMNMMTEFYDYSEGVADKSVFDMPAICNDVDHAKAEAASKQFGFTHIL